VLRLRLQRQRAGGVEAIDRHTARRKRCRCKRPWLLVAHFL
jgi:hypothetical protein